MYLFFEGTHLGLCKSKRVTDPVLTLDNGGEKKCISPSAYIFAVEGGGKLRLYALYDHHEDLNLRCARVCFVNLF